WCRSTDACLLMSVDGCLLADVGRRAPNQNDALPHIKKLYGSLPFPIVEASCLTRLFWRTGERPIPRQSI
ncbi:hypothetical protein N9250_01470, partial [bacterium]|nr:hypothetical protein [bacterium]